MASDGKSFAIYSILRCDMDYITGLRVACYCEEKLEKHVFSVQNVFFQQIFFGKFEKFKKTKKERKKVKTCPG
jgi:hypothetical protein